jgi:hypothetical protein
MIAPLVIPAQLNAPIMSPGHDCEVRGTPHAFNGISGPEVSAPLHEAPAFAGATAR